MYFGKPLHDCLTDTGVLAQTRPEWAVISPPLFRHWSRCRQECLLSDWGVLLLDVIVNRTYQSSFTPDIWAAEDAVDYFCFWSECPPDLPKCVYVCANNLWSSFTSWRSEYTFFLKLQSVTFGAIAVNKQNCVHLAEEHCSRSYFFLFMSMTNHAGTGLLRSVPPVPVWNSLNIIL